MPEKLALILFVNKNHPMIPKIMDDLKRVIGEKFADRYELDLQVLDILDNWEQAKAANIQVTPTLFKAYPLPLAKVTGDLSDVEKIISLLELKKTFY